MRSIIKLFQDAASNFTQAKGNLMAAALAYYALFSISPLLVLIVSLSRWIFGSTGLVDDILDHIGTLVTPAVADSIKQLLESYINNAYSTLPTIISLAVMFFGASIVFVQLKTALNQIWGVVPRPNNNIFFMLRSQGIGFASVMVLGLLLVSLIIATTIVSSLRAVLFPDSQILFKSFPALEMLLTVLLFTILFALMFKILPDAKIAWKDVWLGGFFTSVLFTIGESLLGFYLNLSSIGTIYGIAGSVIVIMIWIYYSSQIILFGAAFTKSYADQYGKKVRPTNQSILVNNNHLAQNNSEALPEE